MAHRRSVLFASASMLAVAAVAAPAFAQQAAGNQANEVQEVVVTGIRASLQKAIQIKKNSDDIVDAVSAEDIGKLPDRNVADALQRIPGVNTYSTAAGEGGFDENDRVSVRGTPPALTNVTIDGHDVSTGDWFLLDQFQTVGRSVSFTLLPSEIVNNVVVDKTQNASLMEGGVAGSVDIQTKSPLDFTKPITVQGSIEGAYNSLPGTVKPQVSGLVGWKSDDGTFGVIAQGFYEQRDVRRYGQETLGWSQLGAATPFGTANPSLAGTWFPTLIGSTLFEQQRTREGGDFAVQWRPNDQFELKLTGFYSDLSATNHNYNYMFWGSSEFNNNIPTSYSVKNGAFTGASFPLIGPAGTAVNGVVVDNIVRPDAESQSEFFNLDGKYRPTDRLTFTGQIGYTRGEGYTPQSPSFEVDGPTGASYAASGNGYAVNFANINPQSPNGLANDWAWNERFRSLDTEFYGKVDGQYRIDDGFWKDVEFGVRYADHTRQVDGWDRGCSIGGPTNDCWAAPATPFSTVNPTPYPSGYNAGALGIPGLLLPIGGDPNAIVSLISNIANPLRGSPAHTVQPDNYYWMGSFKVHEGDAAGYAMARFGGERWRGNIGLRLVDTQEDDYVNVPTSATAPGAINTSAFGPYYVDQVKHTFIDALPSANLTYDIQPNLLFRVAAAETMSRPDFSALGATVSLTNLNLTGNGGNANLKPIKSDNFDASLEWYYGKLANVSAAVFYMDLQSYVSFGNYQATYLNTQLTKQGGPNVFSTYTISAPQNTTGQVQGFELQWQTPIKYGFGFLANYTYADGEDVNGNPIVGDSKDTFNITGYYEGHGLSARLAYTWRSHVFIGLNEATAENEASIGNLDAAVDYNITPNLTLTLQGLNLTDDLLKYYANNTTMTRAVYENGTQAYFGIRFKY